MTETRTPEVKCHEVGPKLFIHWWKADAQPGDPCLCGTTSKQADDEDTWTPNPAPEQKL